MSIKYTHIREAAQHLHAAMDNGGCNAVVLARADAETIIEVLAVLGYTIEVKDDIPATAFPSDYPRRQPLS